MNAQKPEYTGFNQPEVEQGELEVEDVKEKLVYNCILEFLDGWGEDPGMKQDLNLEL